MLRIRLQFLAQQTNVDVQGAQIADEIDTPDAIDDELPVDGLPGPLGAQQEQVILTRGKLQSTITDRDDARVGVNFDLANSDGPAGTGVRRGRAPTANSGPDTSQQLI